MPKRNKKQNQIAFLHSIGVNASKMEKILRETDISLWSVDTKLGKINIYSRLSPTVLGNMKISKKMRKKITQLTHAQSNECTTDACKLFIKIHKLKPTKVGKILWKSLPKRTRSDYKNIIYKNRRYLGELQQIYPKRLTQLQL